MRNVLNVLGWLFLLVALVIGGRELLEFLDHGRHPMATVQDLWVHVAPGSFSAVQSGFRALPFPTFWDGLFRALVVAMPALVMFSVLAVVLLLAARLGRMEDTAAIRRARRRRSSRLG